MVEQIGDIDDSVLADINDMENDVAGLQSALADAVNTDMSAIRRRVVRLMHSCQRRTAYLYEHKRRLNRKEKHDDDDDDDDDDMMDVHRTWNALKSDVMQLSESLRTLHHRPTKSTKDAHTWLNEFNRHHHAILNDFVSSCKERDHGSGGLRRVLRICERQLQRLSNALDRIDKTAAAQAQAILSAKVEILLSQYANDDTVQDFLSRAQLVLERFNNSFDAHVREREAQHMIKLSAIWTKIDKLKVTNATEDELAKVKARSDALIEKKAPTLAETTKRKYNVSPSQNSSISTTHERSLILDKSTIDIEPSSRSRNYLSSSMQKKDTDLSTNVLNQPRNGPYDVTQILLDTSMKEECPLNESISNLKVSSNVEDQDIAQIQEMSSQYLQEQQNYHHEQQSSRLQHPCTPTAQLPHHRHTSPVENHVYLPLRDNDVGLSTETTSNRLSIGLRSDVDLAGSMNDKDMIARRQERMPQLLQQQDVSHVPLEQEYHCKQQSSPLMQRNYIPTVQRRNIPSVQQQYCRNYTRIHPPSFLSTPQQYYYQDPSQYYYQSHQQQQYRSPYLHRKPHPVFIDNERREDITSSSNDIVLRPIELQQPEAHICPVVDEQVEIPQMTSVEDYIKFGTKYRHQKL